MSRAKLRREIKRKRGGMAEVARRSGRSLSLVSKWLSDNTDSTYIEAHVREYVQELLSEGSNHA